MKYVVTAPYVTVKIPDPLVGGWTMRGFYKGAPLPDDVDAESLRHHVDGGMVEAVGTPDVAPVPEVRADAETPKAKAPAKP